MRSLELQVPDSIDEQARRTASAEGFPDVQTDVLDLMAQGAEDNDHLFTPERLAIIDRADAEIEAGRFVTMDEVRSRLAATKAAWLKANPR